MIINTKSYADFKLVADTLRHLDAVFYNDSVTISGSTYGVAYAIDYQAGISVCVQQFGGVALSLTDFPSAINVGAELLIQQATALGTTF